MIYKKATKGSTNPVGRPRIFSDPNVLQKRVDEYFATQCAPIPKKL